MLTVGGLPLGTVDGFERTAELDPHDNLFCEIAPAGYLPVRFFFNEAFLHGPPPQIDLCYAREVLILSAHGFLREDPSMQIHWQRRMGGLLFTLYTQGKTALCIGAGAEMHVLPLADGFESAELYSAGELFLLEGAEAFVLFTASGEALVRSDGKVIERGHAVKAEVPYHDSLGHTALVCYEDGTLTSCTLRAARSTPASFGLALFECARIGANCTSYLAEALQGKAESLREYLGDYLAAVPTGREDEVGLIFRRRPRIYEVRYFCITLEDGKISNITPSP